MRPPRFPRTVLTIAACVALVTGSSPALADDTQDETPTETIPDEVATLIADQTLLITAGSQNSIRIAATPGTGGGRSIRCAWFGVSSSSSVPFDVYQVREPVIGTTYLLWCWYTDDLESLPGHPVVTDYTGPGVPGEPADDDEVSEFALNSMDFASPVPALSPAADHIVGVESWLAVTSPLDYDPIHANAGPVWVSVWPRFRDVRWDLGNGDTVRCTRESDATTVWDPELRDQSSECVYVYPDAGTGDGAHEVSATVTWTILRRTFEQDTWIPWRDFSLTTSQTIRVTELQAVID
jgi:hypothetical protein